MGACVSRGGEQMPYSRFGDEMVERQNSCDFRELSTSAPVAESLGGSDSQTCR